MRDHTKKLEAQRSWRTRNPGYCEITGLPFSLDGGISPYSPSLDRIDNTRGYVQDNCRYILNGINALKGTGTDMDIYKIAKAIIEDKK